MKKCLRLISLVLLASGIALAAPYTASANAGSQDTKNVSITIQVKNKNMEDVFTEISTKTGFSFHYDKSDLNLRKKVTLNCVKLPVDEVLQQLSEQTGLKFTRKNNKIIVNPETHTGGSLTAVNLVNAAPLADKEVSGTVRDSRGAALPGVTVMVKNTNRGTQTAANGAYVLSVNPGDVLVFRFLGFTTREIAVGPGDVYDVVLEESARSLSEFVVTALGIEKKSKELTYSTQQLTNSDLSRVKDANVINSLAGKAAGVTISRSASGLGGTARVIMRGNKSTRENQPLYVIDGVPMANFSPSQPANVYGQSSDIQSGAGRDGGDGISNINPDDIETINILKGASAAALYGSQAANGVIVITTKKGRAGRTRIDFSSDATWESVLKKPDMQYRYAQSPSTSEPGSNQSWGPKTSVKDHTKDFFNTGATYTNSLALSGGNEIAQSYFSYSNTSSKGIIPTAKFNRHTFNFRETLKLLNDKLTADANITFVTQKAHNRPGSGFYFNPLTGLYLLPRGIDFNTYKHNYTYFSTSRNTDLQNWWNINHDKNWQGDPEQQNPYWILHRNERDERRDRAMASLSLRYQLLDWLSVQARGSFDKSYDEYELKAHASTQSSLAPSNGRYTLEREFNTQLYGDLIFTANKKLSEQLSLTANLGTSITDLRTRDRNLTDVNFNSEPGLIYPNKFQLTNIDPRSLTQLQGVDRRQLQALFGNAQLGFKDFLFLDLTGRNDWSSTMAFTPVAGKGFFYYSAGITGVISEMAKLPEVISFAKVRFSYARVGNDIAPYSSNQPDFTVRIVGGAPQLLVNTRGPFPGTYLKPEDNRSLEAGLDVRFFNDRLSLDLTFYKNNNYRQYFEIPVSGGADDNIKTNFVNLGNIQNKGIEGMLTVVPVKTKAVTWTSNINFAANQNRVVKLSDENIDGADASNRFTLTEFGSNMYGSFIQEGGQWGDIYTNRHLRYTHDGALIVDADGKPLDSTSGFYNIGNPNPRFNLGWNNTIDFRNFSLSFLIDGRFGGKVMSMTQAVLDQYGVSEATAEARDAGGVNVRAVYEDGKPAGTLDARQYYQAVSGRAGVGGLYMYSATNIRLRELAISYKIPVRSKVVRHLQVGLIGRNLLFFKNDAPFDPEVSAGGDNRLQGIDVFGQPATRSVGASLKVGF
ncbi:SusC/RagA family TonB-linked outer membrane protein [Chitinophaga alhagiae]|uniref:SusC/RagA family TonB-linked outer membrane protein n=1 Tax=Chitinophaga alhagiae TaxID=2203219 RepID=UPI000E5AF920|nr:SusC/RagA family TonB-linked outer membrane protein [Chitinophaga alhagiae]